METHSSIFAWEIPQTEKPGGLQPMGSQRVGHNLMTKNNSNLAFLSLVTYCLPGWQRHTQKYLHHCPFRHCTLIN